MRPGIAASKLRYQPGDGERGSLTSFLSTLARPIAVGLIASMTPSSVVDCPMLALAGPSTAGTRRPARISLHSLRSPVRPAALCAFPNEP
ncbi:hypothetical protein VTN96DRAFT_6306 [Rasamsonia emersonii]